MDTTPTRTRSASPTPTKRNRNLVAIGRLVGILQEAGYTATVVPGTADDLKLTSPSGRTLLARGRVGHAAGGCLEFGSRTADKDRPQPDCWAVFHPATGAGYLVPVEDVAASMASLRLSAPKNRQRRNIVFAADYQLCGPGQAPDPRPASPDAAELSSLVELAARYRTSSLLPRQDTVALQIMLAALAETNNVRVAAELAQLSFEQTSTLVSNHHQGRVTHHDRRAGRKSDESLRAVAENLLEHPASAKHRHLIPGGQREFLFNVAIDATNGTGAEIQRFLHRAGWTGIAASTVSNQLKKRRNAAA